MHQNKITQILTSFTEQEWQACRRYLNYCNKKESNVIKVFEYLFKYRNTLDSPKLRRNLVIQKTLPDQNEKAFLSLFSHLTTDVESFIIQLEMKSLLEALIQRNYGQNITKKGYYIIVLSVRSMSCSKNRKGA